MIRRTFIAAIAIIALAGVAALPQAARAQVPANTCQNRMVVDTVYQAGTGGNNFEYFFQLRNATPDALRVDVTFSGFGPDVTLFSPSLPGVPVGANATLSNQRFGRGTDGQINTGTVARVYDATAGKGATIRLTNCRAG